MSSSPFTRRAAAPRAGIPDPEARLQVAENELLRAHAAVEQRYRLAVESAELGVWDFDPTSGRLDLDARCRALFGLSPTAPVDQEVFLGALHPDDRPRIEAATAIALDPQGHGRYDVEHRSIGVEDGVERWSASQGRTIFESGRATRLIGTLRDITAQKSAERARLDALAERLRRSEERYRSLVKATTETVWITTPEGKMRGDQSGWVKLTGQSQDEVQGDGWLTAVHPEDRARTIAAWEAAIHSEEVFTCQHRVRRGDGAWRYFRATGASVRAEDGSIREWFGVHADVTEEKLVEAERERLIAELKRSNHDLDQFVYVTSHDLKAPLRGIANLSLWVEEDLADKISEEGRKQMRLLRGRVHRLEGLINGILSYSRAGRIRERPEPVDVGKLAREVVELLAPPPEVHVTIADDLPTFEGERAPLQQVLMNLIGNALKHAKKSDPRVSITCSPAADDYSFTVKDNGPGISPAFHQRVWIIFQTLEPRDKVEATGVGLSIVKKIVESRGGRVWIDSVPGAGAEFHFSWPARAKAHS